MDSGPRHSQGPVGPASEETRRVSGEEKKPDPTRSEEPISAADPQLTADPDRVIQKETPQDRQIREERMRATIERTIQQLQVKPQSKAEEMEDLGARHRNGVSGEGASFDPEVETIDARRKAAREQEVELVKAVDQSLKKLEQQKLSPAQERQLEIALNTFEKSPKSEADYFQVVAQIMTVADNKVAPVREIASVPEAAMSEVAAASGDTIYVASSGEAYKAPGSSDTQKVSSAGLKEISKILKPDEVQVVKPLFGKANVGIAVKQNGSYKSPLGNFKMDIPGVTSPLSFQDKAKSWLKRVVKMMTGKEIPSRAPASNPELVVSAELESSTPELLAPMESAQGATEIADAPEWVYNLPSWAILLGFALLVFNLRRRRRSR